MLPLPSCLGRFQGHRQQPRLSRVIVVKADDKDFGSMAPEIKRQATQASSSKLQRLASNGAANTSKADAQVSPPAAPVNTPYKAGKYQRRTGSGVRLMDQSKGKMAQPLSSTPQPGQSLQQQQQEPDTISHDDDWGKKSWKNNEGVLTDTGVRRTTPRTPQDKADTPINYSIPYDEMKVLDAEGNYLDILDFEDAMRLADEQESDLILMVDENDKSEAICKIMPYSKYKTAEYKRQKEQKKKERENRQQLKTIRLTPAIQQHDLGIKCKKATGFLEKGHLVRFEVKFAGRQMQFQEKGSEVLQQVVDTLQDVAVARDKVSASERLMTLTVGPKSKK